MSLEAIAFNVFALIAIAAALSVVLSKNPVHSVLYLILAFFSAAGLFVLLGAEFLAMLLVVVYVGAVAVLFLFVVMMLDVDFVELKRGTLRYWPFALMVGLAFLGEILLVTFATAGRKETKFDPSPGAETNTEAIAAEMYTAYLLVFQLSGIILLVAMIGAIVLTLRDRPNVKRQSIAQQTRRRRGEATELVDVEPGQGI